MQWLLNSSKLGVPSGTKYSPNTVLSTLNQGKPLNYSFSTYRTSPISQNFQTPMTRSNPSQLSIINSMPWKGILNTTMATPRTKVQPEIQTRTYISRILSFLFLRDKKKPARRRNQRVMFMTAHRWAAEVVHQAMNAVEKHISKKEDLIKNETDPDEQLKIVANPTEDDDISQIPPEDLEFKPFLSPLQMERFLTIGPRYIRRLKTRRRLRRRKRRMVRRIRWARRWYIYSKMSFSNRAIIAQNKIERLYQQHFPNSEDLQELQKAREEADTTIKKLSTEPQDHMLKTLYYYIRGIKREQATLSRYLYRKHGSFKQLDDYLPEKQEEYSAIRKIWRQIIKLRRTQLRARGIGTEKLRHQAKFYVDDTDDRPNFYQQSIFPISPILQKIKSLLGYKKLEESEQQPTEEEEKSIDFIRASRRTYRNPSKEVAVLEDSVWNRVRKFKQQLWEDHYFLPTIYDMGKPYELTVEEALVKKERPPKPQKPVFNPEPFSEQIYKNAEVGMKQWREELAEEARIQGLTDPEEIELYVESELLEEYQDIIADRIPDVGFYFTIADPTKFIVPSNQDMDDRLDSMEMWDEVDTYNRDRGGLVLKKTQTPIDHDYSNDLVSAIRARTAIANTEYLPVYDRDQKLLEEPLHLYEKEEPQDEIDQLRDTMIRSNLGEYKMDAGIKWFYLGNPMELWDYQLKIAVSYIRELDAAIEEDEFELIPDFLPMDTDPWDEENPFGGYPMEWDRAVADPEKFFGSGDVPLVLGFLRDRVKPQRPPLDPKAPQYSVPKMVLNRTRHQRVIRRRVLPQFFRALAKKELPILREYCTPEYFRHLSKQIDKRVRSPKMVKFISKIKKVKVTQLRKTPRFVILGLKFKCTEKWRMYNKTRTQYRDHRRTSRWRARVAMDMRGTYVIHRLRKRRSKIRPRNRRMF